jgi:hypothetical protein
LSAHLRAQEVISVVGVPELIAAYAAHEMGTPPLPRRRSDRSLIARSSHSNLGLSGGPSSAALFGSGVPLSDSFHETKSDVGTPADITSSPLTATSRPPAVVRFNSMPKLETRPTRSGSPPDGAPRPRDGAPPRPPLERGRSTTSMRIFKL